MSAGFDAALGDTAMGGCRVTASGYAAMTALLLDLANTCAHGRLVLALEGGYALTSLKKCMAACCKVRLHVHLCLLYAYADVYAYMLQHSVLCLRMPVLIYL